MRSIQSGTHKHRASRLWIPDFALTVQDALGQWRDSDTGRIVREPSKVLTLILGDEREGRAAISAIADAYKTRFRQQAVAVVVERGCVAF